MATASIHARELTNGELPAPAIEQGLAAYHEFWRIVRRRKLRILLTVVLALAGAAGYCAVSGPWYDSSAQLLVLKKRLDTTPITGPDQAHGHEDYLATHMLLITSRQVIGRAVEKANLQELPQFQEHGGLRRDVSDWVTREVLGNEPEAPSPEKLISDIIAALVVTRDAQKPGVNPSNEVLNLSFRGKIAADSPVVLNAVIDSYQEFLRSTYRNINAETLELITQARAMVQKDLDAKERAYQKFLADTPPLWKTQDRSTAHQDRLIKIDARLSAVRLRKTEIEASIGMLARARAAGRNPTATVMRLSAGQLGAKPLIDLDAGPGQNRPIVALDEELVRLQLQQTRLLAIHPKQHPEVLVVNRQIDAVRRMIAPAKGAEPSDGTAGDVELGVLKTELLRQELDDLQVLEQALAKLFANEQKGVSDSYIHEIQDEAHRKGIERDRLLYESVLNRLKEISTVKDFGGYNTQVIGPALRGQLAVRKYLFVFGVSLFGGLLAGFAWAFVRDFASRQTQSA